MTQPPNSPVPDPALATPSATSPSSAVSYQSHPSPTRDADQLKLLSTLWYVLAALQAVGGCIGTVYIVLGILNLTGTLRMNPDNPQMFGVFFVGAGIFVLLLGVVFGGLCYLCGKCLRERRRKTFCFVMACLLCLSFPLGTALGVFTLMVLSRPSVKESFQ